jgi:hypothetical protein
MSFRRLCWPCVATMAAALIAGATALAVARQPPRTATAPATPNPAHSYVDLSDADARHLLAVVGSPWRNHGANLPRTLFERCGEATEESEESYAVTRDYSFEHATYAELRHGNDGTWTALAWQNDDVILSLAPPPPPPPPGAALSSPERAKPAESKRWRRTISGSEAKAFVHEFDQLSRDGVPPIRWSTDMLDGGSVFVEGCVDGRYHLFVRTSDVDAGERIWQLTDQLLAFAGITTNDLRMHD